METKERVGFRVHALPETVVEAVRAGGVDAWGRPAERIVAQAREPVRCCLRNAMPGEELLLFGYEPPLPVSPYREVGAVLVHARPCAGPAAVAGYPADWVGRPQVLRAYDERGWILGASTAHDGSDPVAVIERLLADPAVDRLHSRNIAWGCYMCVITRGWGGRVRRVCRQFDRAGVDVRDHPRADQAGVGRDWAV